MIRLFKILFLCLVVFIGRVDANGADAVSIMNAASSKITGKSVSAAFTVSGSFSGRGTIKASGKKFAVETGSSSVWYDGKSMYTYSSGTGEVTVTIPSVMNWLRSIL